MQRQEDALVPAGGRVQVEQAPVVGHPGPLAAPVPVPLQDHGRTRVPEDPGQLLVPLPEDEGAAGLDDARLLRRDVALGRPDVLDVVDAHVRHDRDGPVGDVGGVVAAAEADLDDGGVHDDVGEPAERRRRDQLEPRRPAVEHRLQRGHVADDLAERAVRDRLAVPRQPLVHPLQVGTGERPDRQPLGDEQRVKAAHTAVLLELGQALLDIRAEVRRRDSAACA